jgi:opacity protein-like surface antigen
MKRTIAVLAAMLSIIGIKQASAQDFTPVPGTLEVTFVPAGGTFFTSKQGSPGFGNYTLGGNVTYNITRIFAVEGEVNTSLGVSQDLHVDGRTMNEKPPNTLDYSANIVVSLPTKSPFAPYVTGGIGGLTMFSRRAVGMSSDETFLTGNVGGGVKWYASNGKWGLRGDYRFIALRGKDDAPGFFGRDDRYGHRLYAGLIITAIR